MPYPNGMTSTFEILDFVFEIFFGKPNPFPGLRASAENIFQIPYLYYLQTAESGFPSNNEDPLSIEAITWCYRVFLLREPENIDAVIDHIDKFKTRYESFNRFLFSPEFVRTQVKHLKLAFPKSERIILIHIPKTGGTSLREWLAEKKIPNVVCVHDLKRVEWRVPTNFENAKQRIVITGHLTWDDWLVSSADKIFSVVREPLERTISYYKYIRKFERAPDPREMFAFQGVLGCSFEELMLTSNYLPPSEQCRYLSKEGTFQAVINNIALFGLTICTMSNISVIAQKLAAALNFNYDNLWRLNDTDGIENPIYQIDELAQFYELNKEDFLLHLYLMSVEAKGHRLSTKTIGP